MSLLDLFSKQGRAERARAGNIKRAVEKYAQSPDRFKALQALRDDGSADALHGLMRRFGMMYDKTIEDEQEKEWVFEVLVEKGVTILPSLERYMREADSISWPLRLLDKVADRETELAALQKILERHEPGYERDPTKKIQLLNHLAGLKDGRVPPLVAPYLADMDEGVRYAAVEALVRQGDEAAASAALLDQLTKADEDSLRIRLQIAEGFADLGWAVPAAKKDAVLKFLPETFKLSHSKDGGTKIEKKPQAKE
jgi:HEAT repeat protein